MNERIKELAVQAKKYALDATIKITDREQALKVYSETYDTKFAELIVNHATECVRDVLREEDSELTYTAASQVQKRIKEYFGVEE